MKQILFTNWHSMRWIRLGIGVFFMQQTIQYRHYLLGVMALVFIFQALFNIGCGLNGCAVPSYKKNKNE
ncbi:hypothetical protein [Flavobacterium crassostreae]|uniref:DUF2892 domain-containing protein n=1 Tax=Flavobacterium crassostreae TaxID=1763534 RepID=A0A1B9E999_9FLAO|nr:hypothetical protein [Flavobacterium crassostreae]OCB78537.1 hypothetical protein LPBF_00635 [Flavobacterium crassostreae]